MSSALNPSLAPAGQLYRAQAQPGLVPVVGHPAGAVGGVVEGRRHAPTRPVERLWQHGPLCGGVRPAQFCAVADLCAGDAGHAADRALGHGTRRDHRRAAGAAGLVQHRALVGVPAGATCARRVPRHQRNGVCHAVCGGRGPGALCGCPRPVDPHLGYLGQAVL